MYKRLASQLIFCLKAVHGEHLLKMNETEQKKKKKRGQAMRWEIRV